MSEPKYRDEEWLREQYVSKRRTTREIAQECGCCKTTVGKWLKKNGIETREPNHRVADKRYRDGEWLRHQYAELEKTISEIAGICDCSYSAVRKWLIRHDIERRPSQPIADGRLSNQEWLEKKYIGEKKSTYEIAEICGCSQRTVCKKLEECGVKKRQPSKPPRRLLDEKWSRRCYIEKNMTAVDIAKKIGCTAATVTKWLKRHGVELRRPEDAVDNIKYRSKDWLYDQYVEKENGINDIATMCGCSGPTILRWLEEHDIETRKRHPIGEEHQNWRGGRKNYGRGWNETKRRQVRERDGYECADCGTTQAEHKAEYNQKLHVHHLIKARDVDDPEERNALENLVTLCRDCHREWERVSEAGIRPQIDGVTAD